MRALQFAGPAIQKNEARIYNCCYLPVDDYRAFAEIMFLLLGGTGVGYSVQFKHIEKLPEIRKPIKEQKFLVGDSIEGWADAVKHLIGSYLGYRNTKPRFDFSDIRAKGQRLITAGGKAPGSEPLKTCLFELEQILERKANGEKLQTIEVHDMICHIADSALHGQCGCCICSRDEHLFQRVHLRRLSTKRKFSQSSFSFVNRKRWCARRSRRCWSTRSAWR
jgi:ribonucleoside-diphosphate reductase alpha chain